MDIIITMEVKPLNPIILDFKKIRADRQFSNINIVAECLKNSDMKLFQKNINVKKFNQLLLLLEMTKEEFLSKCKDDSAFIISSSMAIAKESSRQGSKDENEQLKQCNVIAEKCGLVINNLSATCFRPTKDGNILSKKEIKEKKIKKDNCLKSFDAKISGNINGFISAKVSYGSGGHQDNVFNEMDDLADWWKKYKSHTKEMLIILFDTDLLTKLTRLKEKYNDVKKVKIFNHVEFQQYMIDMFYEDTCFISSQL